MSYLYPYGDSQQLNLSWFLAKFKELYEYVMQLDPSGETVMDVILSRFTEQYDSTRTYIPGDYCIYDGYIYKANTTTGGAFDSSAWDAALPVNDVQGLRILLGGLSTDLDALEQNAVTNVQYTPGAATADGLLRQTKNGAAETVMTVDKEPTENSQNPVKSGAVYEELDELKGSLNAIAKRNFILIGDSFGAGIDGNDNSVKDIGWYKAFENSIAHTNMSCYYHTSGQAGVSGWTSSLTFLQMLQDIENANNFTDTEKNTITDIIVIGGTNDLGSGTPANIPTAIASFMTYVKANYPIAKVRVGCLGTDVHGLYTGVYNYYRKCVEYGCGFMDDLMNLLCNPVYIGTDGTHLNSEGYNLYMPYVVDSILNYGTHYRFVVNGRLNFANGFNFPSAYGSHPLVVQTIVTQADYKMLVTIQGISLPAEITITGTIYPDGITRLTNGFVSGYPLARQREYSLKFAGVTVYGEDANRVVYTLAKGVCSITADGQSLQMVLGRTFEPSNVTLSRKFLIIDANVSAV